MSMQQLYLVKRRFPDLLAGHKTSTIRLNEGDIQPGLLKYISYPDKEEHTFVWVELVDKLPLKMISKKYGGAEEPTNPEDLLKHMQVHYPNITMDTEVLFIKHLTPEATVAKYKHLI